MSQPITVIISNARAAVYLLEQVGAVDRAVFLEILEDIMVAGERAAVILHRIRGFIRNEPLVAEAVPLGGLVAEVLAIIRGELLAHEVVVDVEVDASIPPVRGDRVQLQQVLVNLIINACDAMTATDAESRRIVITGSGNPDGSCELTIADRGPGIALVQLEDIFEPFVTSKSNGVGLGLAICRKVVALHGGRLWAENSASGATFHLVLPGALDLSRPVANPSPAPAVAPPWPALGLAADAPIERTQ